MKTILLSALLVSAFANRPGTEASETKLFFVSSSFTTTTILTSTFCYVTVSPATNPITTCSRKRRRSILDDAADILPEPVEASNVESSIENDDSLTERQGRFLLYWLTTTSTSTATSYTKTVSVVSVYCAPASASLC